MASLANELPRRVYSQLLHVAWGLLARDLRQAPAKPMFRTTDTPPAGDDGKDYRADFVHAPFSEHLSTPSINHARGLRLSSLRKNSPVL
jgi:hypothetical protein